MYILKNGKFYVYFTTIKKTPNCSPLHEKMKMLHQHIQKIDIRISLNVEKTTFIGLPYRNCPKSLPLLLLVIVQSLGQTTDACSFKEKRFQKVQLMSGWLALRQEQHQHGRGHRQREERCSALGSQPGSSGKGGARARSIPFWVPPARPAF